MAEFGEQLRRERESRGVALEAIAEATKINARHLRALEQNEFAALPGGVINKGIVRSYARVVGLDEEPWVRSFMEAYRSSGQMKDDDVNWVEFAENVSRSRTAEDARPELRLRWAGVFLLLVVIVGLGWVVWRYVRTRITLSSTPGSVVTMDALAPAVRGQLSTVFLQRPNL